MSNAVNPFGDMTSAGHAESEDRLGGFQAYETDAYDAVIKAFYTGASAGGAKNFTVILTLDKGEYRETVYTTSKEGKNYFHPKDRKTGEPDLTKKNSLPGWTLLEDFCLVTVGKEPKDLVFEEKVMNIYDVEAQKELPKSVPMAVELIGQKVTVAIQKAVENKNVKDGDGKYVPGPETREVNNIEKVFHSGTKATVVEAREANKAGRPVEAVFYGKWVEKNRGQTRDKTVAAAGNGGQSGRPGQAGGPPQAGQQTQQRQSLFN